LLVIENSRDPAAPALRNLEGRESDIQNVKFSHFERATASVGDCVGKRDLIVGSDVSARGEAPAVTIGQNVAVLRDRCWTVVVTCGSPANLVAT
jgi:hypothetical protein